MQQTNKVQDTQLKKSFNFIQFQTQMSQDVRSSQKQFSPWFKKQPKQIVDKQINNVQNHHFLKRLNIKPRKIQRQTIQQKYKVKEDKTISKNKNQKIIKAQKLCQRNHHQRMQIVKYNNRQKRYIQQKSYFDNKKQFNHFHQKPKCIDLRLNIQQNRSLNRQYVPLPPPYTIYAQSKKKNQTISSNKKSQNKQETLSNGQKQFAQTMKDFHKNFPLAKKNVYNTLQLNVFPYNPNKLQQNKNKIQRVQYTSVTSRNNRYDQLLERSKIQPNIVVLCQGKNLPTPIKFARKQKLKQYFSSFNN